MRTITLVRHATAVDKSQDVADFDRGLTKDGSEETRAVARALQAEEMVPDLILSSPAVRAFETARKLAKILGYPKKDIVVVDSLYENIEPPKVLELLKSLNDDFQSVMVVGHDPVLSEFAGHFGKDVSVELPKGSALCLRRNRKKWANLLRNDGQLKFLVVAEKPAPQKSKKEVKKTLSESMQEKLAEAIVAADFPKSNKVEKKIKATAKELADKLSKTMPKSPKAKMTAVVHRSLPADK